MHGIQVDETRTEVSVGLLGEFDIFSLQELREALDRVSVLGKPVVMDLSRITFLDLQSARELMVRALIQAHQLTFENPSPGVLASLRTLGLDFATGHEEPRIFSGA